MLKRCEKNWEKFTVRSCITIKGRHFHCIVCWRFMGCYIDQCIFFNTRVIQYTGKLRSIVKYIVNEGQFSTV